MTFQRTKKRDRFNSMLAGVKKCIVTRFVLGWGDLSRFQFLQLLF